MFIETMRRFSLKESDPPGTAEPEVKVEGDPPEEGGKGDPPKELSIPLSALPPEFKDKSLPEIQFMIGRMAGALTNQGEINRSLTQELADLKATPPEPPEPDPYEGKTFDEVFAEDPKAGVMRVLKETGMIDRFNNTVGTVGDMLVDQVAGTIDGFAPYTEEVKEILKSSGVVGDAVTKDLIVGAYSMAVGTRQLEAEAKKKRELGNPEIPTSDPPEGEEELPELTGLEKEIFEGLGMKRERYEAMKSRDIEIKVPTSPAGL